MTDADKTRIEIEKEADRRASRWLEVQYTCAKTEYIAGATVWAERLKKMEEENERLSSEFIKLQKKISDYSDEYAKSSKVDTSQDNINYFVGKSEAYAWAAKTLMNSIEWLGLKALKSKPE